MIIKKTISSLVLITITIASFSQNLLRNPGFENGEKSYDDCVYWNGDPTNKKACERFNNDCNYWTNANPHRYLCTSTFGYLGNLYQSSDWYWYSMCPSNIPTPYLSDRCIRMAGGHETGDKMYDEGVYSALISKLQIGKEYKIRVIMAVEGANSNATLHIWFTKWHKVKKLGECWAFDKKNNQRWVDPVIFKYNAYDDQDQIFEQKTRISSGIVIKI